MHSVVVVVYNNEIFLQIVECKALLPTLVLMLRSEDITIHCVAVRRFYEFTESHVFFSLLLAEF